jgi:NAD(P)-dependent dehydrogenase (short-subunit alcohol dehydrogenase family)
MRQVFLITGSSGMARATAKLAAGQGHAIFIAGIDESECRKLASELPSAGYSAGDLCDEGAAEHAINSCTELFGTVDALFNVAGVSGRKFGDGPLHECSLAGWQDTLDANMRPTFLMSRGTVRYWLGAHRGGAILNMGSVLASHPEPAHFATHAYAASKGAVISMSRAMAAYYAHYGIRVNVIAPGLVKTPMTVRAQSDPEIQQFIEGKQPLAGGMLEAADIAHAALFLLSDESRHMTGQVVEVDGGWSVSR